MNELAMVEYLLKKYAEYSQEKAFSINQENYITASYYNGKTDLLRTIIRERFDMKIRETDTEYIAYNSVCSVRVKK